jgi:hypothetical protein
MPVMGTSVRSRGLEGDIPLADREVAELEAMTANYVAQIGERSRN